MEFTQSNQALHFPEEIFGEEVQTLLGTLIQIPEPGHTRPLLSRPPIPNPVSAPAHNGPHPDPAVLLSSTIGKLERTSKNHPEAGTRKRLLEATNQIELVLDTIAQEDPDMKSRKVPLSIRVIRALTRLKKHLPTVYKILIICLLAVIAPLVLPALPALPMLGI